jgi:hypothetical protein
VTELVIDVPLAELPPSPNQTRGMHWAQRARYTADARRWAAGCGLRSWAPLRGDWIIKGVKGELYPCKPDIFDATYELVSGTPEQT